MAEDTLRSPALGVFVHARLDSPMRLLLCRSGVDYVCVDLQHGTATLDDVTAASMAARPAGPTVLARPLANRPEYIGKLLDAGAAGVIVPMVNTADEAAAAVASCAYPPGGERSYGPVPAATVYADRYRLLPDGRFRCMIMIETAEALGNVDAIAAVPGVSGLYVGPADLSLALGLPPQLHHDDPAFTAALARIHEAAHAAGKQAGIHAAAHTSRRRTQEGYDMITVTSDLAAFAAGLADHLATATQVRS